VVKSGIIAHSTWPVIADRYFPSSGSIRIVKPHENGPDSHAGYTERYVSGTIRWRYRKTTDLSGLARIPDDFGPCNPLSWQDLAEIVKISEGFPCAWISKNVALSCVFVMFSENYWTHVSGPRKYFNFWTFPAPLSVSGEETHEIAECEKVQAGVAFLGNRPVGALTRCSDRSYSPRNHTFLLRRVWHHLGGAGRICLPVTKDR
jgi:hypothetical protein